MSDIRRELKSSNMTTHMLEDPRDVSAQDWSKMVSMKVVEHYRIALDRQIGEAIKIIIENRKDKILLNNKE